jgi:hypothetical protein
MGRVRRVVVVENDMLLFLAALDYFVGSRLQFGLDLVNQGHDKGRDDGEDENRQLLLQLFDNLGKDRDSFNRGANALHDAIVEFDGGHDRPVNILDVYGEFLGILWRDWLVFFLDGGCIRLDLVELVSLIASRKDAGRELAEERLKKARISILAFVKCSLKLVDLVLSQLVGYWKALDMMISNYGENLNPRLPSPVTEWRKSTPPNVPVTIG